VRVKRVRREGRRKGAMVMVVKWAVGGGMTKG
jgi:hypothetical protein